MVKPAPSKYRRTPGEAGPPYGFADLPCRLEGELTAEGRFVPHARPHDLTALTSPWLPRSPRLHLARQLAENPHLELELGLTAAHTLLSPYSLSNALLTAGRVQ